MDVLLWGVLPYLVIATLVLGTVWRYRYDKFGWTTRSSQLYESRLLRLGSPLFHFGILVVFIGHVGGLLIPEDWTEAVGISEGMYHFNALLFGGIAGFCTLAGIVILIVRRRTSGPVFMATTTNDKVMYVLLVGAITLGLWTTLVSVGAGSEAHNYRETVSPWFRSVFRLDPDVDAMAEAPVQFHVHVLVGMLLFAAWPFTRLVHAFTAPVHYLFRPYIVYRSRDARIPAPTGRPRAGWTPGRHPRPGQEHPMSGPSKNLALATLAFAISFWAWNMIAPLGVRYADGMDLSAGQKSLLVATPVLVGSLGRILAGALTDRFGGRLMFTVLLLATAPFVLLVAFAGREESYGLMLLFGFFLGIGGTTFAVGIPFVNAWFSADRRGFATGVFGAGMGGTALSAFFTPRFVDWFGYSVTHVIVAAALVLVALLVWTAMRDSPQWHPNTDPVVPKLGAALRLPLTWQMSFLYAVAFGGFVAFSTYLPTYLKDVYDFDLTGAGTRTAGFAIAAVVFRPVGGVLSDRVGPRAVAATSFAGAAVMAIIVALQPAPEFPAGLSFVVLAAFLGLGTGGVFAWVAALAPKERVGSVSGIVGAAGGLGGFFPPLVMGATYDEEDHSYTIGLMLLCATALVALLYTLLGIGRRRSARQPSHVES